MRDKLLEGLGNYSEYITAAGLDQLFPHEDTSRLTQHDPSRKESRDLYDSVDPSNQEPFSIEWDDLVRLHHLVRSRRVTTILEFGVGKSTAVLMHGLKANEQEFGSFVRSNLRRSNAFELHTVDNYSQWIEHTQDSLGAAVAGVHFHLCDLVIGTFNDRLCTYYEGLPDICPDFIYLDGPDQFSAEGDVRGLSTRHPDRLPMAADLLVLEHFLLPGTLVVVDGRAANARFLKSNFQRGWSYEYSEVYDQHFFELMEPPLGSINARQIDFCLGHLAES